MSKIVKVESFVGLANEITIHAATLDKRGNTARTLCGKRLHYLSYVVVRNEREVSCGGCKEASS